MLPNLESKFHAIVNPDIILKEDTFSILLEFMKDETIGMAVPRMVDEKECVRTHIEENLQ